MSDEIKETDEDTLPIIVKTVGLRDAYIVIVDDSIMGLDLFVGDELLFHGEFNKKEIKDIVDFADDFLYCRSEWKLH